MRHAVVIAFQGVEALDNIGDLGGEIAAAIARRSLVHNVDQLTTPNGRSLAYSVSIDHEGTISAITYAGLIARRVLIDAMAEASGMMVTSRSLWDAYSKQRS